MRKTGTIIITIIILALAAFIYWRYFFVFAECTRAGILNTFQKKGYIFKTYEGQLIQSGFRGSPTTSIVGCFSPTASCSSYLQVKNICKDRNDDIFYLTS